MTGPSVPSDSIPRASRAERLLVCWLALTFLLGAWVALPGRITAVSPAVRNAARSYLRTIGLGQSWALFSGGWDMPQLRIIATTSSGAPSDVTHLYLHGGILYRSILDDRMEVAHIVLARVPVPALVQSYASALRRILGPGTRAIEFHQVYREARVRPRSGSTEPTTVVPLVTVEWKEAASP